MEIQEMIEVETEAELDTQKNWLTQPANTKVLSQILAYPYTAKLKSADCSKHR